MTEGASRGRHRRLLLDLSGRLALGIALIPFALILLSLAAWLRHGVDIPWSDDWRAFIAGRAGSLDPAYLFMPENSTFYPVGKFLDSLAQRVLAGNAVIYQSVTMLLLLGSLLLIQLRMLQRVMPHLLLVAAVFSLTLLALRPDTYWGRQSLSYHQALPVVFILGALAVVTTTRLTRLPLALAVAALGALAGLSYLSGAFATLAAGVALAMLGWIKRRSDGRVLTGGVALSLAGAITSLLQLQAVPETLRYAYPWELDFWMFLFGKVSRSLALPATMPELSLSLTLGATATALSIGVALLLRWLARRSLGDREQTLTTIYLPLGVAVGVYLMLVAAARTYGTFYPADATPLSVFVSGYARFHYWWATAIWPWVGAALLLAALRWASGHAVRLRALGTLAISMATVLVALVVASGAVDYNDYFERMQRQRLASLRCIQAGLATPAGPTCIGEAAQPENLRSAVAFGQWIDASFARYLIYPPLPTDFPFLYSLLDADPSTYLVRNAARTDVTPAGMIVTGDGHPALVMRPSGEAGLDRCETLNLTATFRVMPQTLVHSAAQFTIARLSSTLQEDSNQPTDGDGWLTTSLDATSPLGFANPIRFTIFVRDSEILISRLTLSCRVWLA